MEVNGISEYNIITSSLLRLESSATQNSIARKRREKSVIEGAQATYIIS